MKTLRAAFNVTKDEEQLVVPATTRYEINARQTKLKDNFIETIVTVRYLHDVVVQNVMRGEDRPPGLDSFLSVTEEDIKFCVEDEQQLEKMLDIWRQLRVHAERADKEIFTAAMPKLTKYHFLLVQPLAGECA